MSLDLDLITTIDARVKALLAGQVTAWGTVADLTGQNDAMVTFDGSAVGVPVKVAGDVQAFEGDRVALIRVGGWWLVVASMTRRWLSVAGASAMQSVGNTTSSSMSDTTVVVSASLVKRWAETRLRVQITGSAYVNAAGKSAKWGAHITSPTHADYDLQVVDGYYDNSGVHLAWTDWAYVPSGDLPAGMYTVKVQWASPDGVTAVSSSAVDRVSLDVAEIAPS